MQKPQNENDQVQAMLAALLQLDASGRERWLREHGGDTAVVSRVMELLSLAGAGSGPDPDAVTTASAPDDQGRSPGGPTPPAPPGHRSGGGGAEGAGDWIGPYKLLEIIGEGGFGTVWLAERRQPMVQRVAVKIIKAGMDTRAVVARFEQERQALAVMNHPNIARVFDAGTTDAGRPYFVMEYVAGEPITRYADRQNLTVRQRLELFIPVCEAVQHAHHKGMIHRDIKPSNILVGVSGGQLLVKVIDFGVAKAISHTLTDHSIFTESGQLIGTPEYMSPEQAEMGATDIDTRTDVYSLGVVLYELLSGLLPFDAKTLRAAGYDAIRKVLREQDAPKPSTRLSSVDDATGTEIALHRVAERDQLANELRRELDWIPLKALRKDRTQRYDTPVDLAKDIQRYLDGEALEAGPEATGYRLKKFLRRNKRPVAAVGAVVITLSVGVAGMMVLWRQAVVAGETIEANAYLANIEMAAAAMEFRQFGRVRQRLDACPERLRAWEWGWLNASVDTSLVELKGHTKVVSSAAFSPDGARIVTASADETSRVWDAASGKSLAQLKGHTDRVSSAAFSPDGTRIVTTSRDKTARVWDATTGTSLAELKGHTKEVSSAAFSPDGTRIVMVSEDETPWVWDAVTGKRLAELKGHSGFVGFAEFSPDGKWIVTASVDETARMWDATTGTSLAELKGHTDIVDSAAFSPDGTRIVTTSRDKTARVWDVTTGTSLAELKGHSGFVDFAAFSPDGTRIVTASKDETARVWDAVTGNPLTELKGYTKRVRSAAFSPDGTRIVTRYVDNTALVWDAVTGTFLAATGMSLADTDYPTSWVSSSALSPDGTRIVTASADNIARVWDTARSESVTGFDANNWREGFAASSPDGTRVLTVPTEYPGDGVYGRVRCAATAECLAELEGISGWVSSAAFSPDGTRIMIVEGGRARLWDAITGKSLWQLKGHMEKATSAVFSPDGTRIATASRDRTARVWDAATGTSLVELKGHTREVDSAAFSPDGMRVVTASSDCTARLWDAATGTSLAELKGHNSRVTSAAFSSDGTRIVTVSMDRTARVWDAATGTSLAALTGHTQEVFSAEFNRDSTRVVTASGDGTARVWDVATGMNLAELKGHTSGVSSAAFSPDGARIATASWGGTVRVWDAATGKSFVELTGDRGQERSVAFSPDGTRIVSTSRYRRPQEWDSVPYRERFPAIQRERAAAVKMESVVDSRLKAGESAEAMRIAVAKDTSLSPEERIAAQAALFARIAAKAKLDLIGESRLDTTKFADALFTSLANDSSLAPEERTAVRATLIEQIARRFAEASTLDIAAWVDVRFAPQTPEAAAKALVAARRVVELAPEQGACLNTLGVALYRAVEFKEALDTLTRSHAINAKGEDGPLPRDIAFIAMCHWQLGHKDDARTALATLRDLAAKERWKDDEETIRHLAEAEALIAEKQ
jgi:WD40 repeat protein/serine/threonine protein kinase